MYELVSLDLADRNGIMDETRRWLARLAAVRNAAHSPLRLHFILGAPQDPALRDAYERAVALVRKADLK